MVTIPPFVLIDEPWIQCIDLQGQAREVGLRELLLQAHELREIHDDSPLVTAALLRVPLAILHRCWQSSTRGARTREWKAIWQNGCLPTENIEKYLQEWRDRFDLFSTTHPFFQTADLQMNESSTLSRLALEEQLTSAIFAHDESPDWSAPSPALAARLLVATQSFALGFGKSSRAKIGAEEIEPPYSADAILLRGVTVWLTGKNLFETLLLNLVPQNAKEEDAPCWELSTPHELRDQLVNGKRRTELARGPMDRFTWQSRLICLLPEIEEGRTVVRRAYFTQGRSLDKSADVLDLDPMKTYRRTKSEGFSPVALSEQKAAWRDAHALLDQDKKTHRATAFDEVAIRVGEGFLENSALYDLHVVGLAAEPGKAGKFLLWRHDRMPAPAAILQNSKLVEAMQQASADAEFVANNQKFGLNDRMRRVCRLFLAPECEMPDGRKPHPDDVTRLVSEFDPRRAFWPRLEAHFYRFLMELGRSPENINDARENWRRAVETEATRSFRESLRALGTSPRAIRAAAHVREDFWTEIHLEERQMAASKKPKCLSSTRKAKEVAQ